MAEDLSGRLMEARKARRLTRSGLADEIGLEVALIEAFETGKAAPDSSQRALLSRLLKIDLPPVKAIALASTKPDIATDVQKPLLPSIEALQPSKAPTKVERKAASLSLHDQSESADEERAERIIELLERVTGSSFFYSDGRAFLVKAEQGISAKNKVVGAYALLTDLLLTSGFTLDKRTTDDIRKLLRN